MTDSNARAQDLATLQEILTQPQAWRDSLDDFKSGSLLQKILDTTAARTEWLFVGCGTSFYLAEAAAASWTMLTGQFARAMAASEILLFPGLSLPRAAHLQAVIISRSGSTSEAVRAAVVLKENHRVSTIGITCSPNSPLESACEITIQISSADERSTVMTRSFTSMLLVLQYWAAAKNGDKACCSALENLAAKLETSLPDFSSRLATFADRNTFEDYIFLGQGPFHGIAREAALKLMEMSCSFSQSYHTLEFRHGPKAIVGPETCLTFLISESGKDAESEVLAEMKELGGVIIAVCNTANKTIRAASDLVFELELDGSELFSVAPSVIPAQLLGCYAGLKKGLNPDAPKNLTRVVLLD
jgi:glucosamine--fructose-6-phosphate aminotransferase (isomerizing)